MSGGFHFHLTPEDAPCRGAQGPYIITPIYSTLYLYHSFYDTVVMGIMSVPMERTNDPDIMDNVYCFKTRDSIKFSPLKFSKPKMNEIIRIFLWALKLKVN
jgi:hypothetical protein